MAQADKNYINSLTAEVARLEEEKKAIAKEFENVVSEEFSTPEKIREHIRNQLLPAAWVSLQDLIMNAESEGVRASLCRWVVENSAKPQPTDPVDPDAGLTKLLKEIATK